MLRSRVMPLQAAPFPRRSHIAAATTTATPPAARKYNKQKTKSQSTTAGFEPTRAEHTTVLKSLLRPLGHVVTMGRHFFDIPYVHTW